MIQIKCADLGYDGCPWTHTGNSEYELLDIVGMHLREAHKVKEVDLDLLGRIRTSLIYPRPADAAAKADLIMGKYNCECDPECNERFKAAVEDLIENKKESREKKAA